MKEHYDPWYVRLPDGRTIKAKSTTSVRHHIEAGHVPLNSMVRRDSSEEWVSLIWVAEFADFGASPGATPPTPSGSGSNHTSRSGVSARLDPGQENGGQEKGTSYFTSSCRRNVECPLFHPGAAHGAVTVDANGSFTYTPNANYNGSDSFTFKANDGTADSNIATVSITVSPVNDGLGRVGNFVWVDWNRDGLQSPGEPGRPGVTVRLIEGSRTEPERTTTTDALGKYLFSGLDPTKTYRIKFDKPVGFEFAKQYATGIPISERDSDADATGLTGVVEVFANSTNESFDAGLLSAASVGDRVWIDLNANGLQDYSEPGQGDLTVKLLNLNGSVNQQTTTSATGFFRFDGLDPTAYFSIQVVKPTGYAFTSFLSGANSNIDSDTDPSLGRTYHFQVPVNTYDDTFDTGLLRLSDRPNGSIVGPGAVPGNSVYAYSITVSGNVVDPLWVVRITDPVAPPPDVATVLGFRGNAYDPGSNTTTHSIDLQFGNSVPAQVFLEAWWNGQLYASKEILIVKVSFSEGNLTTGTPQNGFLDTLADGTLIKSVSSGAGAPPALSGATWSQLITLTGPQGNRGVDQINVGYIQHVNLQTLRGQYEVKNPVTDTDQWLAASIESPTSYYLDMMPDSGSNPPGTYTDNPWYNRDPGAVFFDATTGINSKRISSYDTPALGPPLTFQQATFGQLNNSPNGIADYRRLTRIRLNINFNLDLAAQTKDTSNGANNFYWGEFRSEWYFNGTGNVGGFNANASENFKWTSDGAKVESRSQWSVLPLPTQEDVNPPIANTLFGSATFNSSPPPVPI